MKSQLCRIVFSGLIATGLTLGSAVVFAQQDSPAPDSSAQQPGAPAGHMGRHQPMSPDEQVAHMTKRYNLSADQQSQIKPIVADAHDKMMAVRQDSSMSRDDKMSKMMSIRQDSNSKIAAVLNDTQKQQFTQDQQRMQERMQQRGGGAPPPQQ